MVIVTSVLFELFKLGRLNTSDAQASSGPKLVDFKAALVKPENEVAFDNSVYIFNSSSL